MMRSEKSSRFISAFVLSLLLPNVLSGIIPQFNVLPIAVEASPDPADWYEIGDVRINVSITNYFNLSIQRSNSWIDHYYWYNATSDSWVDVNDGVHPLIAGETEEWQYVCPTGTANVILNTSDVLCARAFVGKRHVTRTLVKRKI